MSIWTETGEKTLDTIKLNAAKLSEKYLEEYNTFKNWLMYMNAPLVLLSAANAYAIIELDSLSQTIQFASAGSSILIATIIGGEMCLGVQKRLEQSYKKYRDFDALKEDVSGVLTLKRDERKVDANTFLSATFKKYQELTKEEKHITKFAGNAQLYISDRVEDMQSFVEDHWNILFRPHFRRIKQKNEKVINALKETGQNVQSTLTSIVEPVVELAKEGEQEIKKSSWFSMFSSGEKAAEEAQDAAEKKSLLNYLWSPFTITTPPVEEKKEEKVTAEMEVTKIYSKNDNSNKIYDTISHKWVEKK